MDTTDHSVISNPGLQDSLNRSSHGWDVVSSPPGATRKRYNSHDFPGYGSYNITTKPSPSEMDYVNSSMHQRETNEVFLEELEATAISGNDILSSTFYVSGLVTLSAGKLTPVCLVLVGVVLYLFRGIYHETVTALPINGGTYNILLNCTSKQIASMAAVLNIIAYITTGVVSGLDAVAYLQTVLPPGTIDQKKATIGLLAFFCLITNLGMKESATVAKVIFVAHLCTLTLLTFLGCYYMAYNTDLLYENWDTPYPSVQSHHKLDVHEHLIPGTMWTAIFYGFSSAMLGVSGFETSSQFVEEQAPGVFPKTLRNMWAGVMFFNPLLSLISFSAMPVALIMEHKSTVLARTAQVVGGWVQVKFNLPEQYDLGIYFSQLVSIDAFIVLAAALLTSFVGINGLIRRMSMDRCLPQVLLWQNPLTGTDSIVLIGFFFLCSSQIVLLDGNVEALSGVYCYSFLGVMTIFAVGNILLKVKRPSLPREISVGWIHSIIGLLSVMAALLGNILSKPELLTYFFLYFFIVGALVYVMFQRVRVGRLLYKLLKKSTRKKKMFHDDDSVDDSMASRGHGGSEEDSLLQLESSGIPKSYRKDLTTIYDNEEQTTQTTTCLASLSLQLKAYQDVPFVFFCKHDDLHLLNKAILYIQNNEQTNRIIIVHCVNGTNTELLAEHVKLMDLLYPKIKISLLIIESDFSPGIVDWVSGSLNVPTNAMFICCPDENFAMKVNQLRGMRIITSYD